MFKKNFTIPLSVFIALSCGSVNAADKSTAFDDAVANLAGAQSFRDAAQLNYKTQISAFHQAQAAEKDALDNFNAPPPGTDRQTAGIALTQAEQDVKTAQKAANIARNDVRFATNMVAKTQQEVNGTNYRAQIQALQATMTGPQTPVQPTQTQTPPQPQTPAQPTQPQPPAQQYTAAQPDVTDTIKQPASKLQKDIPVDVTIGDKVIRTTVGEIAKVNPQAQISVPYVSAFTTSMRRGNNSATGNNGMRAGHEGRGADNAHSHAFGGHGYGHDNSRSEGFGGHSQFH